MSQFDYGIIDPSTKSGSQLAADLSSQRLAVNSHHLGASEPVYKTAGMIWVDIAAAPIWRMKMYDGAAWINLFDIDILADSASSYINGLIATLGTAAGLNVGTGSSQIPQNSMLGALAYLNTVNTGNIANAAITAALIAAGAIGTAQLANGAVTAQKIAAGSIDITRFLAGPASSTLITNASGIVEWGQLSSGVRVRSQLFSTVGTATFTPPAGVTSFKVTVTGGGGGGGGISSTGGYGGTSSFGSYCSGTGGQPGGNGGGNFGSGGGGVSGDIILSGNPGGVTLTGGTRVYGGGSYWGGSFNTFGTGGRGSYYPAAEGQQTAGSAIPANGSSGGGGGGGTAIKWLQGLATSVTVTIGAGGGVGSSGGPYGGEPGIKGACLVEWVET